MKRKKMGTPELRRWVAICLREAKNAERRINSLKTIAGMSDDDPSGLVGHLVETEKLTMRSYKALAKRFHPDKKTAGK